MLPIKSLSENMAHLVWFTEDSPETEMTIGAASFITSTNRSHRLFAELEVLVCRFYELVYLGFMLL